MRRPIPLLMGSTLWLTAALVIAPDTASAAPTTTISVPGDHATIQAAVDAAPAGSRIVVGEGVYVEQVSIDKDLTLVGAGGASTIIEAPDALVPGLGGRSSIVEVDGAKVRLLRLGVRGPGAGTCDSGALWAGIFATNGAELTVDQARVTDIRDAELAECVRSGNGIIAGGSGATAQVVIRRSYISGYQSAGVVIRSFGSTALIDRNLVLGPGATPATATGGIELVAGATGVVTNNIVAGNACGSAALGCGPDFFTEFQLAGIAGGGPGTSIGHNLLVDNQVGIYVGEEASLVGNVSVGSHHFGLALQDGEFTVRGDRVIGGGGGVAVIASAVDTVAHLQGVRVRATTGSAIVELECCGFTATAMVTP